MKRIGGSLVVGALTISTTVAVSATSGQSPSRSWAAIPDGTPDLRSVCSNGTGAAAQVFLFTERMLDPTIDREDAGSDGMPNHLKSIATVAGSISIVTFVVALAGAAGTASGVHGLQTVTSVAVLASGSGAAMASLLLKKRRRLG